MTKRIFRAICLVAIAVFISSMLLIMGVLYSYFSANQMNQLKAQTALAARGVENEGEKFFEGLDTDDFRLTWVSGQGQVLYDSQADASQMENHLQREEIREAIENGEGESTRYSDTLRERELYSAKRLADGTVIRLSGAQHTILSLILSTIQPIVVVVVAAVALSLLLARRIAQKIVEPLNEINLNDPIPGVYDELSPMVERLLSQKNQLRLQETELQRRKDELGAATAGLSEGLVLLSGEGSVLSINPAALSFLKIDSDPVGKPFDSLTGDSALKALASRALSGEHGELPMPEGLGECQINASPVISGQKPSGAALLIFDISEKEKAEQIRREFTANVSHELKTPLHTISGCAELLSGGMVEPEDVPRFSKQIYSESKRMIALVEDIIGLSHLDEGAADMEWEDTDLYTIAQKAVQSLQSTAEGAHVTLTLEGSSAPMHGIPQLLSGIVFNLCDNAIKYNRQNGSVKVQVGRREKEICLTVSDTGIGIPAEQQERIFERFYRVDKSHSKEMGGTGLGLSIVKHAARAHKAKIALKSKPDVGTDITVSFPL